MADQRISSAVRIKDSAGADVTVGQKTMAASLPFVLASDQPAVPVSVGAPTNPATDIGNLTAPVNLAAGASGNADSADLPSKRLRQVVVSGSVCFKVILSVLANGVATAKVCLFGGPFNPVIYSPPHQDFFQSAAATAGADGFRAAITNLDPALTADFYATYMYADN